MPSNETTPAKSMPRGLALAFGAFFATIFVANGILIYQANSTWNGVITKDAYNKGVAYNQVIAAQQTQDALGWQASLTQEDKNHTIQLTFTLQDRQNHPITAAKVEGTLFRPVQEGLDQTFTMVEEGAGRYTARLTPPLPGWWDVRLKATTPDGEFRYVQRLQLTLSQQGR